MRSLSVNSLIDGSREFLKQYFSLLKTLLRNNLSLAKINKKQEKAPKGIKKAFGTIGVAILVALGCVGILAYLIVTAMELTLSAIQVNAVFELQYAFIALAELAVLFFGLASLMSNLYFSKDNALLLPLPFKNGVVFSAKFTVTYLSELFFATIIYLPLSVTSGITLITNGINVGWSYFLVVVLALLMLPALPLLISTILSQPLMLLVSKLKKKSLANSLVMGVIYAGCFALYFVFIMASSVREEDGSIPNGIIGILFTLKKVTIFNYPLVESLMGNGVALNLFIYFVGVAVVFTITVLLSNVFYRRTLLRTEEGDGVTKKKLRSTKTEEKPFLKSYILKDLRNVIAHPSLLLNIVLMVVMPIVVMVVMSFTFGSENDAFGFEEGMNKDLFLVAIFTYVMSLMICAGNPIANVGFSLEGKNLLILKSFPLDHKQIIKAKMIFASFVTTAVSLMILVAFPLATGIKNAVAIIGLPLSTFVTGVSYNAMGLLNDLKRPNYSWVNLNEITRNNTRNVKPMLLFLALSFLNLVLGIFTAVFGSLLPVSEYVILALYYLLVLVAPTTIFVVYYKRLLNAEELFEAIGG